jgi:hypothetical protein
MAVVDYELTEHSSGRISAGVLRYQAYGHDYFGHDYFWSGFRLMDPEPFMV